MVSTVTISLSRFPVFGDLWSVAVPPKDGNRREMVSFGILVLRNHTLGGCVISLFLRPTVDSSDKDIVSSLHIM